MPKTINTAQVAKDLLVHEKSQTIVEGGDAKQQRMAALKEIAEHGGLVTLDDEVEMQRRRRESIERSKKRLDEYGTEGRR